MKGRILIIDDEETLCYFLRESLEEKGYQAAAAHTAGEGLKQLAGQDVDLVLLDLKLPDGEGLDVLSEIRRVDAGLPVIVLTGHAAVESAVRAMKLGAYDYLEKPINLAQLSSSVAEALDSRSRREGVAQVVPSEREVTQAATDEDAAPETGEDVLNELGKSAALSRKQRQLERKLHAAAILDAVSSHLIRSLTVDELAERTAEELLRVPSVDMAAVFVGDGEEGDFVLAAQRRFPSHVWEETALRRVSVDGVLAQAVARWDRALPLSEAGPDPWVDGVSAGLGNDVATALVPLRDGRQLRGLMLLVRRGGRQFDQEEVELFCTSGERLASAVARTMQLGSLEDRVNWLSGREADRRRVLETMAVGVLAVDSQGRVRLVNPAGERLLGCREEEVLNRGVEDLLGNGAAIVRDSIQRDLVYAHEEISVLRLGGEAVPLEMSVSPLRGGEAGVSGAAVTLSDLRPLKEREEERRKLDRTSLLAEVAAVVAHEIRNPLAGMGAGIQHLMTKFEEGDGKHEALERVLKEGERVNAIIEDILLITRPPHLDLAPCDVAEVVQDSLNGWNTRARTRGVEVRRYLSPGLPPVKADRERLGHALTRLLSNALEAMPNGGDLEILVTGPPSGEAGYVDVEIRDTGVGIKREDMDKIFEPFYSTRTRGTGLGLTIAKRIIDEHGGEIDLESEEGGGTKVVVRLPLAGRGG
jgi:two-component system nitrogen regulation sensor histidine kinase GlnL